MAQDTFGSPIKKIYGEQASLTTTALHLGFRPNYHEVLMYCPSAWRMGLSPRLARVKFFDGATSSYTDYTLQANDRDTTTDVVLDAMATNDYLYLGFTENTRGFYFTMDGTNKNVNNVSLDMEYLYDVSGPGYKTLTGTVSGAMTVGETITGSVSGATGIHVYDNGSTTLVIKTITGRFAIGENAAGASQACNTLTVIEPTGTGTGYFTDVGGDSDGTDSSGSLAQSGLYAFTLPATVRGAITAIGAEPLYWYRFAPSGAFSANVQVNMIYAATDTVNYGFMEAGISYQFSLNVAQSGAFEFDHTASDTLDITWIRH